MADLKNATFALSPSRRLTVGELVAAIVGDAGSLLSDSALNGLLRLGCGVGKRVPGCLARDTSASGSLEPSANRTRLLLPLPDLVLPASLPLLPARLRMGRAGCP